LHQLCAPFDSVSICFSKGLGAPVGSVLVGSGTFIDSARRWRKVLGGGMRQSGILAAACLFALDHHVERLQADHDNALRLARGLREITPIKVLLQATNMVLAAVPADQCAPLETWLRQRDIRAQIRATTRFVTHLDVDTPQIDTVLTAVRDYFKERAES
jgi:threonine aldolase